MINWQRCPITAYRVLLITILLGAANCSLILRERPVYSGNRLSAGGTTVLKGVLVPNDSVGLRDVKPSECGGKSVNDRVSITVTEAQICFELVRNRGIAGQEWNRLKAQRRLVDEPDVVRVTGTGGQTREIKFEIAASEPKMITLCNEDYQEPVPVWEVYLSRCVSNDGLITPSTDVFEFDRVSWKLH